GSDLWSDEPGFEETVAQTGVTGICGSGIIEVIAEMYLAGIINQDGLVDGGMAEKSSRIRPHKRTFTYVVREGEPFIALTQHFVEAMAIPHKTASFTNLAKEVKFPAPKTIIPLESDGSERRKRRRG